MTRLKIVLVCLNLWVGIWPNPGLASIGIVDSIKFCKRT